MKQFDWIERHLVEAAKLLPAQGPITAFVFLNSLQALEDLPFEQGLERGRELFGCEIYLSEDRYRQKMAKGRIRAVDLVDALQADLGVRASLTVGPSGTLFDLRMAMLTSPIRIAPAEELNWFVAETQALTQYRAEVPVEIAERATEGTRQWVMREVRTDSSHHWKPLLPNASDPDIERWTRPRWTAFSLQALWAVCRHGVQDQPILRVESTLIRHRDLLKEATGEDCDRLFNEVLIPFCARFADQGLATWELPNREAGFWATFVELYGEDRAVEVWLRDLPAEIKRVAALQPAEIIADSLQRLGVTDAEGPEFLTRELLALRGWAGTIWQAEDRGDRFGHPMPAGTLLQYMAVRLVLLRVALDYLVRRNLPAAGSLAELRQTLKTRIPPAPVTTIEERAIQVFQLAQSLGWSAADLSAITGEQWSVLVREIEAFDESHRRRLFHLAFERRFRVQALDAIAVHTHGKPARKVEAPVFQSVYCIDTREESFRRHLEETCPRAETFGAAGFFGVAMYFKGVSDAHYQALCPIVVRPKNYMIEEVVFSLAESNRRRSSARKRLATASHQVHVGSRSLTGGALLTATLGVFASIPLVARVLFPATTSRLRKAIGSVVEPPRVTRLRIERLTEQPGPEGDAIGYSLTEMADVGERILSETGLRSGFARLVFFFGHGSFCLNNPHKSCYDCGACSGSAGGANARALAAMLNDTRVRKLLAGRGIAIPDDTMFIGGLHNTATDTLTYHDLDQLPHSHNLDFETARDNLEEACRRNAQERCRRFYSAPLDITPSDAHFHVETRSEDLAQTRPEFGNASNAMCVVGRRGRTRGLYLDRRSFLVSYDPTLDDAQSTILGRILGAVVIVCSGINLQYFFSYIDSTGWGAGTKLPHNITSLLGVMDGAASDLRTGLPWQGVEIHEPVRCLFIIEAKPEAIEKIMQRNPTVGNILRNGWVQLALLDPDTTQMSLYQNGEYVPYTPSIQELPHAKSSVAWFQGWREHMDFAEIGEGGGLGPRA